MPPRAFTNPAPKTESARSALNSFTCTLCSKSYSRHPEYESHIGSYDHQHRKRLQDLKQLSRDPNAAEKARRAERKADADAGLRVIDTPTTAAAVTEKPKAKAVGGGGFKKGGFESSFSSVKASGPVKRNVLGDEEDGDIEIGTGSGGQGGGGGRQESTSAKAGAGAGAGAGAAGSKLVRDDFESDTDEEYGEAEGGYYDPRKATGCFGSCAGVREIKGLS